jgi:hypothetical protein
MLGFCYLIYSALCNGFCLSPRDPLRAHSFKSAFVSGTSRRQTYSNHPHYPRSTNVVRRTRSRKSLADITTAIGRVLPCLGYRKLQLTLSNGQFPVMHGRSARNLLKYPQNHQECSQLVLQNFFDEFSENFLFFSGFPSLIFENQVQPVERWDVGIH